MKFTKEKTVRRNEWDRGVFGPRTVTIRRPNALGYAAMGIASIPVLAGLFGDSYADLAGDKNTAKAIPTSDVNMEVLGETTAAYNRTFAATGPAGKFALQYLTSTNIVVEARVREPKNGNGIAGYATGYEKDKKDFLVVYNNGCLNKTSYDINGGDIEGTITGVFTSGSVKGEVPTAAASAFVDSSDPDTLVVSSGNTNSRDLRFSGITEGLALIAADQQTKDVLETYGCSLGVQGVPSGSNVYSNDTSPWVNK